MDRIKAYLKDGAIDYFFDEFQESDMVIWVDHRDYQVAVYGNHDGIKNVSDANA